jgi:MFS family permease
MSDMLQPFRRMKWGFLPQKRIVAEDPIIIKDESNASSISTEKDETFVNQETHVISQIEYEYRDEKDRKWWKFFDEYEYRVNNNARKNKKWYKWFHESDTSEERKVILKIDLLLTFYSLMAYWVKYLDQTNLTNAYIGGLKEDIGMKGNDFVNTQVMFSVGNIIFQIPFIYVLYACPLNYVLPSLDIVWSILTICLSRVTNVGQLKVLRFFIGAAEAPSYLAYHSLFASWFKSSTGEGSRRAGFYYLGQYLGILTSGLLSGAIERNLGGVGGHTSWQWIFIMDGIISLIVGFIGFYMIPGTPDHCYSPFLSDNDIRIARKRMKDDGKNTREENENPFKDFFKLDVWKTIFSSWHIYVLSLWNIFCWNNSSGSSGSYALWLKSLTDSSGAQRFSPGTLQDYTALTPGLGLLWLILTCSFADFFNSRWGAIIFSQVFNVLSNLILAIWNVPERAKWFAFCLQYFGWAMAPVLYSWQGDICRRNLKERNVVLVSMNILAQQSTAWISVLVWKTVEAPRFLKGFSFTASSGVALSIWTIVVLWFYKREERLNAKENGIILYNSANNPESN